jgi:hypothetical protein
MEMAAEPISVTTDGAAIRSSTIRIGIRRIVRTAGPIEDRTR